MSGEIDRDKAAACPLFMSETFIVAITGSPRAVGLLNALIGLQWLSE